MSTSVKIFRPWTSSVADEPVVEDRPSEAKSSAFTRVPEPGHPASEFSAMYEHPWTGFAAGSEEWTGFPIGSEEWVGSMHMLPFQTAENLAQNLSYLDPAYLNYAFSEIYGGTKASKLKQRPKKFRCPHCKVSFSNNGQLKGHVRIHTGEYMHMTVASP